MNPRHHRLLPLLASSLLAAAATAQSLTPPPVAVDGGLSMTAVKTVATDVGAKARLTIDVAADGLVVLLASATDRLLPMPKLPPVLVDAQIAAVGIAAGGHIVFTGDLPAVKLYLQAVALPAKLPLLQVGPVLVIDYTVTPAKTAGTAG